MGITRLRYTPQIQDDFEQVSLPLLRERFLELLREETYQQVEIIKMGLGGHIVTRGVLRRTVRPREGIPNQVFGLGKPSGLGFENILIVHGTPSIRPGTNPVQSHS